MLRAHRRVVDVVAALAQVRQVVVGTVGRVGVVLVGDGEDDLDQLVAGVVAFPIPDGPGRVLACEVMIPNPAIRNLIREDKVHQIYTQMQVGQDKFGMITLNQSLFNLAQRRLITVDEAFARTGDPDELKAMLQNAQGAAGRPGSGSQRK